MTRALRDLLPALCASGVLLVAACSRRDAPLLDGGSLDLTRGREVGLDLDLGHGLDARDRGSLDAGPLLPAGWPSLCGKPRPAFGGVLCGRAAQPCQVQVKEVLAQDVSYLHSVSLELDDKGEPMGVYSSDTVGTFLRRTGANQWTKETIPSPMVSSALGRVGSEPTLLVHDGAMHQQILRRGPAGWTLLEQLPGKGVGGWPGGFVVDQSGCFHLRLHDQSALSDERAIYGLRQASGAWSFHALSSGLSGGPIALGPDGTPHLAYWGKLDPQQFGVALVWVASPGDPQIVLAGTNDTLVSGVALAVTPSASPSGDPQIFVQRLFNDGSDEVVLVSRGAGGSWSTQNVDSGPTPKTCTTPPTASGQTCSQEYRLVEKLAILPAADPAGLRLLYAKHQELALLTAVCGAAGCHWDGKNVITGSIQIASVTGAQIEKTIVLDGIIAESASTAVDAQGRIHILVLGASEGSTKLGSEVFYLRLGASQ